MPQISSISKLLAPDVTKGTYVVKAKIIRVISNPFAYGTTGAFCPAATATSTQHKLTRVSKAKANEWYCNVCPKHVEATFRFTLSLEMELDPSLPQLVLPVADSAAARFFGMSASEAHSKRPSQDTGMTAWDMAFVRSLVGKEVLLCVWKKLPFASTNAWLATAIAIPGHVGPTVELGAPVQEPGTPAARKRKFQADLFNEVASQ